MYKFVIVSVIALVVLQGALARPKAKPATAPAPAEKSQIDELAGQAKLLLQNVSQVIEGNIPDSKKVSETLNESSQAIATKLKSAVDELTQQAKEHEGDIQNFLNSAKDRLKESIAKLQTAVGPEATQKAKDIKAKIDENVNEAISEAQRLAKAAEPEVGKLKDDLNSAAKNLIDNLVEVTKNLQSELKKNVDTKN